MNFTLEDQVVFLNFNLEYQVMFYFMNFTLEEQVMFYELCPRITCYII